MGCRHADGDHRNRPNHRHRWNRVFVADGHAIADCTAIWRANIAH